MVLSADAFWCQICAENPKTTTAKYSGSCSQCQLRFTVGTQIGWAPVSGSWCYYCVNGKDSQLTKLSKADKEEMQGAVEIVKRYGDLPDKSAVREELQFHLELLRSKYANVKCVKDLLKRF